jgi:hypothetical protein
MNNVGLSKLFNKVFIVEPIKVSEGSRFFNNRNDEEPKPRTNKYAIKTRSAKIAKDGIE